jgi:2-polyprenyl-3-methyl-5-hydroxy-6-metoxy-1,4-benzoquinol methylase
MAPYGQSLLDFYSGETAAAVTIRREDGLEDELPASIFFREPAGFSPQEQAALALCQGHVLDIGAGTGCHSLALQERGMRVLAIDVSPQAIEIMAHRGVKAYRHADVFEFHQGRYDTLLLMMHGIGMVQDLSGLDRFLSHAHELLQPGGQILLDSLDVRSTEDPQHLAYQAAKRQAGRYVGEICMQFGYKGHLGPLFGWLHVDPVTLAAHAARSGWTCQIVHQEDDGNYLARLTPI